MELHKTFKSTHLVYVGKKGLLVIGPFCEKLRSWWVLAAAQLKSDFKAVPFEVVVILHPPCAQTGHKIIEPNFSGVPLGYKA